MFQESKMLVETLKCDECGKLRVNDSNHWMCGWFGAGFVAVGDLSAGNPAKVHLCGQECAMKWVGVKIGEL